MARQRRVVFELRWNGPNGVRCTERWWRRRHADRRAAELADHGQVVNMRTTRIMDDDVPGVLFGGRAIHNTDMVAHGQD